MEVGVAGTRIEPGGIDDKAVAEISAELIDWRFKGISQSLAGVPIGEAAARRLNLFRDGFLGPLLVLDGPAIEHNLATMAAWCAQHGFALAPHGKTTMAPQLFTRQLAHGAWGITAANASQLRVYRAFGVSRVLLANQLVDPAGLRWLAGELDADPGFECACWVDSVRGVSLMDEALRAARPTRPLDVLIELGAAGARSGVRDVATAVAVAQAVAASPVLRLVGVSGYEAAVGHGTLAENLSTVDGYLVGMHDLVVELADQGFFAGVEQVIVTAGGSAYFDLVTERLGGDWPAGLPVLPVLRSGAYITHDHGLYARTSPLGAEPRIAAPPLRSALRAWAQVTSRPGPDLALLTAGKRDVPYDIDLPMPVAIRTADGVMPLIGGQITALNDQHAFLSGAVDVEVGDWIGLDLSHPCTTFDKWPLIPVVDADGETVIDLIRTYF
jgi:D-serine deaminase-like pyridoxal phosphate-dependent protein